MAELMNMVEALREENKIMKKLLLRIVNKLNNIPIGVQSTPTYNNKDEVEEVTVTPNT